MWSLSLNATAFIGRQQAEGRGQSPVSAPAVCDSSLCSEAEPLVLAGAVWWTARAGGVKWRKGQARVLEEAIGEGRLVLECVRVDIPLSLNRFVGEFDNAGSQIPRGSNSGQE